MAYTPSTTLTVPTGGSYTPSTTLTVPTGGSETYTLSGQIDILVYEDYTLAGQIDIVVFDDYLLSGAIHINKVETYLLGGVIALTVFENYTLSGQVDINVQDKYFLSGQVDINVYQPYSLSGQIDIVVYETYLLGGAIDINVEDKYFLYGLIDINVVPVFENYTLSGVISISVNPLFETYRRKVSVAIRVFAPVTLSGSIHINKVQPVDNVTLSGTIRIVRHETFNLSRNIEIVVTPMLTGGTSGQGTGSLVVLPTGATQRWNLRVLIGGQDFSSRLTGTANIDKERNSAVIATFSVRPLPGLVNPYQWIKKEVTITYQELDPAGNLLASVRLFSGIVDTPIFDSSSGLVEFTCTDDLQNVAMGSSHDYLADITPLSTWSKYVYDEAVDGWEYLQQRLETYPYSIGLNTNQAFFATPWVSKPIDWEFNENTINDTSLSIALANSGDLVNSVDVTMSTQYDVFREAVFNLEWSEENWYLGRDLIWLFSDIQMICDSVSSAGATFVGNPLFNTIPSSRTILINGNNVAFLNDGSELLALEFRASVSKRYTQNTQNDIKLQVYSPESIAAIGQLRSTAEGSIAVEYPKQMVDRFTSTESVTKWALTAGTGLSEGFDTSQNFVTEPQLFQGSGWVYYPKLPYTFERFKQDSETGIDLNNLNHYPTGTSGTYDFSFSAFGHPKQAGEHFYDLDQYATVGGLSERESLLATLKAQARTTIIESHRQSTVAFQSFIQPRVERGDMVRVNSGNLIASGLVSQIVHEFSIDSGTAMSSITLAVSSVKAIGLPGSTAEVYRLTGTISINVQNIQGSGNGISLAAPYTTTGINYHRTLPCHYHDGVLEDLWEGHVTPADRTLTPGPNQFVLLFPDLLEANTENATLSTLLPGEVVDIDQDELFLISN